MNCPYYQQETVILKSSTINARPTKDIHMACTHPLFTPPLGQAANPSCQGDQGLCLIDPEDRHF